MDRNLARPSFAFSTKGETLQRLSKLLDDSCFPRQILFTAKKWAQAQEKIIHTIITDFHHNTLAVRSSAIGEDGHEHSMAGAFTSLINISPNREAVCRAVDQVIRSYGNNSPDNQVLIQPMIQNVAVSGVVLTRDLDSGSPYYVINYDDFSGRTDSVTAGKESKCMLVHHSSITSIKSQRFLSLISIVKQIEYHTNTTELDIEFCITSENKIYILQVRPLAAKKRWITINDNIFDDELNKIYREIEPLFGNDLSLSGHTTIFSEMADWNPAEMIGNSPRPLALSLYKYLITDGIWSTSRARMGYNDIGITPLLIDFSGKPYIDVRKSLNSLLPPGLNPDFYNDLIDFQLRKLQERTDLHDKIEFEIAITCCDFLIDKKIKELQYAGFHKRHLNDFQQKLSAITQSCLKTNLNSIYAQISELKKGRTLLTNASALDAIKTLLTDCKKSGTFPFSQLARHAFIGVSFLKSAIELGILTKDDFNKFLGGIKTVATDIIESIYKLDRNEISQYEFMKKFGHLRPGTYDITSYRYDEKPELYFGHSNDIKKRNSSFSFTPVQKKDIGRLLNLQGLEISADELIHYITHAVTLRELAKFEFTHNISDALVLIEQWGSMNGISRDDTSFLDIKTLLDETLVINYKDQVAAAKQQYEITKAIRLPHLISEPDDIFVVRLPLARPTFITNRSVTSSAVQLSINTKVDINNKLVLIESADPGFDWIFSHKLNGLITKYGGANSHMAIRCAEFGLPAAIGCGERIYETLTSANLIKLDCAANQVERIC